MLSNFFQTKNILIAKKTKYYKSIIILKAIHALDFIYTLNHHIYKQFCLFLLIENPPKLF